MPSTQLQELRLKYFVVVEDLHEKCCVAKYPMRLHEIQPAKTIKPIKPKTPDQQRIATMKANAKRADQAVQAERARQQQRTAQQALVKAKQPIAVV